MSVAEIMAAGGPEKYAKTIGVDPAKVSFRGGIKISKAETLRLVRELKKMG